MNGRLAGGVVRAVVQHRPYVTDPRGRSAGVEFLEEDIHVSGQRDQVVSEVEQHRERNVEARVALLAGVATDRFAADGRGRVHQSVEAVDAHFRAALYESSSVRPAFSIAAA